MNELIPLHQQTINQEMVQTVSARELHEFLEVQTAFKDWIARRIADYDFDDGIDFCSILSESSGGRPSREYYITLDMAKELAMVERNEKGKQARKYFIECEKKLLTQQPTIPTDPFLLIAHFAQQAHLMQQKQLEMDTRLQAVEQKQQRLDQDVDHYTIKGFCSLQGIDLSNGKMSALSKKAKKLSEVREYTYHEISDPRFGKVKTYHIDILLELFQMQNLI